MILQVYHRLPSIFGSVSVTTHLPFAMLPVRLTTCTRDFDPNGEAPRRSQCAALDTWKTISLSDDLYCSVHRIAHPRSLTGRLGLLASSLAMTLTGSIQ
jgi:hypothetical protein